jgi:hypothetical protein
VGGSVGDGAGGEKRLKDEEARVEGELDRAFSKALREIFDPETVRKNVANLRLRKEQIKSQLARLEKDTGRFIDDGLMIIELVQNLPRAFERATDDQRHRMLRVIFEKAVVEDGRFTFFVNEPFLSLHALSLGKSSGWLLGQDSNLQPSGYKRPKISSGLGLSLHPSRVRG